MGLGTFIYPECYSQKQAVEQAPPAMASTSDRGVGAFPCPAGQFGPFVGSAVLVCW